MKYAVKSTVLLFIGEKTIQKKVIKKKWNSPFVVRVLLVLLYSYDHSMDYLWIIANMNFSYKNINRLLVVSGAIRCAI